MPPLLEMPGLDRCRGLRRVEHDLAAGIEVLAGAGERDASEARPGAAAVEHAHGVEVAHMAAEEPLMHSMSPSSSTRARLVFRLYMFFDQFSMVEYRRCARLPTKSSTAPACRLATLYLGAEQPSIKCRSASSSG